MKSALEKLQGVTITESSMQFISNFTYNLGTDDLTAYGALQLVTFPFVPQGKGHDMKCFTPGPMTLVQKHIRDTVLW